MAQAVLVKQAAQLMEHALPGFVGAQCWIPVRKNLAKYLVLATRPARAPLKLVRPYAGMCLGLRAESAMMATLEHTMTNA
mmetsp:Transcript_110304/g.200687  ORF Transcript_110304/g.200687 Transcript_110304/m.200687 type:complete len:80 (-) Transcript_110304:928-1167(-)